jgi:glutamyl-tRNA synthetase
MKKKDLSNEIYAYALENSLAFGETKPQIILPKLFQHGLKKTDIQLIMPKINEIVKKVNKLSKKEKSQVLGRYQRYLKEKPVQEHGLKPLPNLKGKPVFRLAPFPSGSMHIGNTRTYLLNALYAEKYKGTTKLVIDDTIGSDEKGIVKEAYDLIPKAFDYLNVKYKKPIIYKSDRLETYYKYAKQIIRKNKAYVCACSQEELRENRIKMKECSCRQFPVKMQLARWKEMFKASQGSFVLRIKTSMQHKNPAFRDRVLFRISEKSHPRTKKKYRVWPLLEFSWAIDDHLLKITHIIRGKDLMIEGEMQKYIWDIFKWKHPEMIYSGLIKLEGIGGKLGKSKSQKEVASGEYLGWHDPRTWSVQSLQNRGILPEAIREFVEKIGISQKDITIPIDDLYAINRRLLDSKSNRYFFVENPVEVEVENQPKENEIQIKIHPDKKELKTVQLRNNIFISLKDFNDFKNKEVRLMHLYNIKLDKKSKFKSKENKDIQKIHWVSKSLKTKVLMPSGAYSIGLAESGINKLKKGETIQFERFGFCKFHNYDKKTNEYIFWFAHD